MGMDSGTSTRVGTLKRREIRKSHSCHLLFAHLGAVGGDLNPLEQSQLLLIFSLFMRRTNLTFGQNGDEVKPLTTNEMKPLSEDELRTLSRLNIKC